MHSTILRFRSFYNNLLQSKYTYVRFLWYEILENTFSENVKIVRRVLESCLVVQKMCLPKQKINHMSQMVLLHKNLPNKYLRLGLSSRVQSGQNGRILLMPHKTQVSNVKRIWIFNGKFQKALADGLAYARLIDYDLSIWRKQATIAYWS